MTSCGLGVPFEHPFISDLSDGGVEVRVFNASRLLEHSYLCRIVRQGEASCLAGVFCHEISADGAGFEDNQVPVLQSRDFTERIDLLGVRRILDGASTTTSSSDND